MKKLIPVLLSLLMALAMTATALAATVYTEGALHYTIADESITITGYFGKDAAVTVPASIAGIPVNTIAKGAFTGNDNVKTVDLPDTIKPDDSKPDDSKPDDNKPADNKPNNGGTGADTGTVDVDNSGTAGDTTGTTGGTGGAEDTGIDEGTVSVDDLPDSADSQTGAQDSAAVPQQSAGLTWLWVLLGVIAVAAIIGIVVTRKKKH